MAFQPNSTDFHHRDDARHRRGLPDVAPAGYCRARLHWPRPLRPTESCALITRYNPLISKNLVMRSPTKGCDREIPKSHSVCVPVSPAASLLVSCGGGGAWIRPVDTGPFAIESAEQRTWYAGVKNTLAISGRHCRPTSLGSRRAGTDAAAQADRRPHALMSCPTSPAWWTRRDMAPGALPECAPWALRRAPPGSFTATAAIKVAQNFLTGCGVHALATTCTGAHRPHLHWAARRRVSFDSGVQRHPATSCTRSASRRSAGPFRMRRSAEYE